MVEQTVRFTPPRLAVRIASALFVLFLVAGALLMATAHYAEALFAVPPVMVLGFALVLVDEWSCGN